MCCGRSLFLAEGNNLETLRLRKHLLPWLLFHSTNSRMNPWSLPVWKQGARDDVKSRIVADNIRREAPGGSVWVCMNMQVSG